MKNGISAQKIRTILRDTPVDSFQSRPQWLIEACKLKLYFHMNANEFDKNREGKFIIQVKISQKALRKYADIQSA